VSDQTPDDTTEPAEDDTEATDTTEVRDKVSPTLVDSEADSPATDVPDDEPEPQSKREARYRTALRETEAERDTLAAKVEALQRAEAERLAAKVIQKPGALWAAQTALADLLNDDGTVDPRKVTDAATTAQKALGLAATRPAGYVAREGTTIHRSSAGSTWEAAFRG